MNLYLAEGQVGSYFLTVISDTPAKAMQLLKKEYTEKAKGWKSDQTANEWVYYQGIRAQEIKLNEVKWS